ncbi:hypothetical protein GGH95_000893, partial [Coemansia sp. RSA 1836]
MALTDITQRANSGSGARTPTRQTTLFDALNAVQRRGNKRQRRPPPYSASSGQENTAPENNAPENNADQADGKVLKRIRLESLEIAVPAQPQPCSAKNAILPAALLAAPRAPAALFGGLHSMHAALRLRQRQPHVAMRAVSTIGRLEALISPEARVYRLLSEDDTHIGALPLACKYSNATGERSKLALVDEGGM